MQRIKTKCLRKFINLAKKVSFINWSSNYLNGYVTVVSRENIWSNNYDDKISLLIGAGVMIIFSAMLGKMSREQKDGNKPHKNISR